MSTYYRTAAPIFICEIFDGRLEPFGMKELIVDGKTTSSYRCLTDGENFLWVEGEEKLELLTRRGWTFPLLILQVIGEVFKTKIYSEYEGKFWGFESDEEWDEYLTRDAEKDVQRFYKNVIAYINGEPSECEPGTVGYEMMLLAKEMAQRDPGLLTAQRKKEFVNAIESEYQRDSGTLVHISQEKIEAFVQMHVTDKDDLPQA